MRCSRVIFVPCLASDEMMQEAEQQPAGGDAIRLVTMQLQAPNKECER